MKRYEQEKKQHSEKATTKTYAVKVDVNVSQTKEIAMPITQANIHNPEKPKLQKVDILLDSASASTFINEKLAESLQLPVVKENILLEISTFGNSELQQTQSKVVIFQLEAEDGELIQMDAYTIPTLTQPLPKIDN
uniref:Peptidase aspartic putative domain-containing protein n=1 Tax=Panagrolaimus sp. ES5 TaxID=591445 RepID=A0AC34GH01_9BILA